MSKLKQIIISFLFALIVSAIQFWVAIKYSRALLWQVDLMHYLVGPGPILGYKNGQPLYEGTPVHMVAAFVGLGLGVVVYWIIGYFLIKKGITKRSMGSA
jgi:hypothetical protein